MLASRRRARLNMSSLQDQCNLRSGAAAQHCNIHTDLQLPFVSGFTQTFAMNSRNSEQPIACFAMEQSEEDLLHLPIGVRTFTETYMTLCKADNLFICDGSKEEFQSIASSLQTDGVRKFAFGQCQIFESTHDPRDHSFHEGQAWTASFNKHDCMCRTEDSISPYLGRWMNPRDLDTRINSLFPGCMKGRTMFLVPFCMGSSMVKDLRIHGVQLTDSPHVVMKMHQLVHIGRDVLDSIDGEHFIKCVHSMGHTPGSGSSNANIGSCDPVFTASCIDSKEIFSYGGTHIESLGIAKQCLGLQLSGMMLKQNSKLLVDHMSVCRVSNPDGGKLYVGFKCAIGCEDDVLKFLGGRFNGWSVKIVTHQVTWLYVDKNGRLKAINPMTGVTLPAGLIEGTHCPASGLISDNSIFSRVNFGAANHDPISHASTSRESNTSSGSINSSLNCPADKVYLNMSRGSLVSKKWADPYGVAIDAIVYMSKRPTGVPMIYETYDWEHGVLVGAGLRSEISTRGNTATKSSTSIHDPFAMRRFLGHNFGDYLTQWLRIRCHLQLIPKVFHLNLYRESPLGQKLWSDSTDISYTFNWIFQRLDNQNCGQMTAIGIIPRKDVFFNKRCNDLYWDMMFKTDYRYLSNDIARTSQFLQEQAGLDLPVEIMRQLVRLRGLLSVLGS